MRALAPEHLHDLQQSGLSEQTITVCRYASVRPHDIKIPGVESAYELPYFQLDGTVNCFARWRLFPPVQTDHGTRKYDQPEGSDPQLYLPPLLDWRTIAADPTRPLVIVEGEKKAAAMCQAGLACMGIGGTWGWRQKLDATHRLLLPLLDQFNFTNGRLLEIVADSDAWRPDKLLDVLSGFYCLGMALIHQKGAVVQFVRLLDRQSAKVGPDDFLVHEGAEWPHAWRHLERLKAEDQTLKPVQAWWQGWQEKQQVQEALREHDAEALEVQERAGVYMVRSAKHSVTFTLEQLEDRHGSTTAELSVLLGATILREGIKLNLNSDAAQARQANSLKAFGPHVPWKVLLHKVCPLVLKRHRSGQPIVILEPGVSPHVPFLINPFVHQKHPSLIYAPGGSLKSYLALYLALLASHGAEQHGIAAAMACPVLLCDWELNQETVAGRLTALRNGHPELTQYVPFYRRCERPLHQEVGPIARHVAEHGVELLILDSAAMACGADLFKPDTVTQLTRTLRSIGCASLLLAHVSKLTPEGQERSAFGSVFFRELARNVWEAERAESEGPTRIILTHTKHNFTAQHPPLAFEITFDGDAVKIIGCDPREEPAFEEKLTLSTRIRRLLDDGGLRTLEELATALGLTTKKQLRNLSAVLSQGKKARKWCLVTTPNGDRWTVLKGAQAVKEGG